MEKQLFGRYINYSMIAPLLEKYPFEEIIPLGTSVKGTPINLYQVGKGNKKILMWSQMHGNESTTTKAFFDVLNELKTADFLSELSVYCIPMLNPDGAEVFTRVNYNGIDLNRDANELTQPESKCLRKAYDLVQPDYCFNLHDQRTIFSVGQTSLPATVSFLAPAYNNERSINAVRQKAMEVIIVMNNALQRHIPNQVARFDDSFNINCTGDQYTYLGTPTILFEAGHYPNDYNREQTREYIAIAIFIALQYIAFYDVTNVNYKNYFSIPENDKCFYDIILRDDSHSGNDVGILYKEVLENEQISFVPYIAEIGDLSKKYGHKEETLSEFITSATDEDYIRKHLDLSVLKID
ncbi:peptidase M14 [Capnocytophaga sp. HP1101]